MAIYRNSLLMFLIIQSLTIARINSQNPIEIRNEFLKVSFDSKSGDLIYLGLPDNSQNFIHKTVFPFEIIIEGNSFFQKKWQRIESYEISTNGRKVANLYKSRGVNVTHIAELSETEPLLTQQIDIECIEGGLRKLTEVRYIVPSLAIGTTKDCLLQVPGQLIPADSPYPKYAKIPLDRKYQFGNPDYPKGWFESAPDQISGLIAVQNTKINQIISAWNYSEETTSWPNIDGDGQYITVGHNQMLGTWLKPGVKVVSKLHQILFTKGSWKEHLAKFRGISYRDSLVTYKKTPEWFKNANLLQLNPRPVSKWAKRLEEIKKMGFDIIYLMPVWSYSGFSYYALMDHYKLDNKQPTEEILKKWGSLEEEDRWWNPFGVGTEHELKKFVEKAHGLGLKVFFDFIPQGIGVSSPFVQQHWDWLEKDELGRPYASHGWGPGPGEPAKEGTYSLDWGNPEYRKYAIEWALWNIITFDIDGFRTDAMHWKEPNFDLKNPRPAWMTMFGGVRMIEELRDTIEKIKPGFILLSEVWGPIFQRAHDGTYENGWLLAAVNKGWLAGKPLLNGYEWKRYLADCRDARPENTIRAAFLSNHDNTELAWLAKQSKFGNTVSFVHIFSGGMPFIWQDELKGKEMFFTSWLNKKKGMAGYTCKYDDSEADSKDLFTAIWCKNDMPSFLVVANLSDKQLKSEIKLNFKVNNFTKSFGDESCKIELSKNGFHIDIQGAGYALIEFK